MLSGAGKEAKTKVGKWIEKIFGDGAVTNEAGDCFDEGIKVVGAIIAGNAGSNVNVHHHPGSEDPSHVLAR